MTDNRRDALPVVPNLSVREDAPEMQEVRAEQGPAPADLAGRAAPPVPAPSGDGLSAAEVARLTGSGNTATTDRALNRAEGVDPDASES
ncbi:hypothetical protein [Deinococcus sp. Leaf326]|uniref:hypothetical protein n=1 Tax=Deinococcus sp. Leaf326 TaxID=1736338 RepID=UPI0006F54187|nr:hypothetical protein [Deinococcus sp. Leaf326]KQR04730.1 hypothetical protein ASF71_12005 [Deinococcus sp. Leaf326]